MAQRTFPCTSCGAPIEVPDDYFKSQIGCMACGMAHAASTGTALIYAPDMQFASAVQPQTVLRGGMPYPKFATFPQPNPPAYVVPGNRKRLYLSLSIGGLILVVFGIAAIPFIASTTETTDDWYEHVSARGRFRVKFPSEPLLDQQVRKLPDGERTLHRAMCVHDGVAYQVVYFDVDVWADWGYQFDSAAGFQAACEKLNARLESSERMSLHDFMGDRGKFTNDHGYRAEFIVALIDNRVFVVGCESTNPDVQINLRLFSDSFKYIPSEGTRTPEGALIRNDLLTEDVARRNWVRLYKRGRSWSHFARTSRGEEATQGLEVISVNGLTATIRSIRYSHGEKDFVGGSDRTVSFDAEWQDYLARRNADPPSRAKFVKEASRNLICYFWGDQDTARRVKYAGEYAPFLVVESDDGKVRRSLFTLDEPYFPTTIAITPAKVETPTTAAPVLIGPVSDICVNLGEKISESFCVHYGTPPFVWRVHGLPEGVSWTDQGDTLNISGAPAGKRESIFSVEVTDRFKRTCKVNGRILLRIPPPADAGPMVFGGGRAWANLRYKAVIEISPIVGKEHLRLVCDEALLPPGLTIQLRSSKAIEISGIPTTKGTYNFDVRLDANLPDYGFVWVTSTLAVRIAVEAGPHECIEPLLGRTTLIAIEDGPYGLTETEAAKQALSCLAMALPRERSFDIWFRENGTWRPKCGYPNFVHGQSSDAVSIEYHVRNWCGYLAKSQGKSGEAWSDLPAKGPFMIIGAVAEVDAIIIVSPLSECENVENVEKLKAALEVLASIKGKKIGILTTRAEIPVDFKAWLESKSISLVQLQP